MQALFYVKDFYFKLSHYLDQVQTSNEKPQPDITVMVFLRYI